MKTGNLCYKPARGRATCLRCRDGVALLEILITLVILSGGLAMVLRASHGALEALRHSRESLWSGLMLRERMPSLPLAPRTGAAAFPREREGRPENGAFAGLAWTLETREATPAAVAPSSSGDSGRLIEITLRVRRDGGRVYRSAAGLAYVPSDFPP